MTGNERRKTIQRLAAANGNLSAREMAEHFGVSRMTIHRDFQALEEAGKLKRFHGGAAPDVHPKQPTTKELCKACNEPVLPHQRYLRQYTDHCREFFCCACCGLRAQLQQVSPGLFYATDMISGKLLPAEEAYFLIRSSASPCCQPSILTFADEAEVIAFHSGFGGVLGRITEALDFLHTEQALKNSP